MLQSRHFAFVIATVSAAAVPFSCALADEGSLPDWSGFYAGLGVGAGINTSDPSTRAILGTYFLAGDDTQLDGILGARKTSIDPVFSALFGYDFQRDAMTFGMEVDAAVYDYSGTRGVGPTAYNTAPAESFQTSLTIESNFGISLRPRIGYAFGQALLHAGIGPSLGSFRYTMTFVDTSAATTPTRFDKSTLALGVSAAVGASYRIGGKWDLRGDYVVNYYPDIVDGRTTLPDVPFGQSEGFVNDASFLSQGLRLSLVRHF